MKEEYREIRDRLRQERQDLETTISKLEQTEPEETTNDSQMLDNITNVLDIIHSTAFTMQEKNVALKSVVDQIVYYKDRGHIDVDYYLTKAPETA